MPDFSAYANVTSVTLAYAKVGVTLKVSYKYKMLPTLKKYFQVFNRRKNYDSSTRQVIIFVLDFDKHYKLVFESCKIKLKKISCKYQIIFTFLRNHPCIQRDEYT